MKHLIITLLLTVTTLAFAHHTEADEFYLGGGVGITNFDVDGNVTELQLKNGNVLAGNIYAGWNPNPYFGLEAMVMHSQEDIDNIGDVRLWQATVAPKLMLPFKRWHYFISLSPMYAHAYAKNEYDGLGLMFQTGANFQVIDELGIGVRYVATMANLQADSNNNSETEIETGSLMVSLHYTFK